MNRFECEVVQARSKHACWKTRTLNRLPSHAFTYQEWFALKTICAEIKLKASGKSLSTHPKYQEVLQLVSEARLSLVTHAATHFAQRIGLACAFLGREVVEAPPTMDDVIAHVGETPSAEMVGFNCLFEVEGDDAVAKFNAHKDDYLTCLTMIHQIACVIASGPSLDNPCIADGVLKNFIAMLRDPPIPINSGPSHDSVVQFSSRTSNALALRLGDAIELVLPTRLADIVEATYVHVQGLVPYVHMQAEMRIV